MARDGDDRKSPDSGGQNGTTRSHAIRRAAFGGSHNHAVAGVCIYVVAVDVDLDVDHPNTAANDDVIDRPSLVNTLTLPLDQPGKRGTLLDVVSSADKRFDRHEPVTTLNEGEESYFPKIDAEQRHVRIRVCGTHHESIATKHDDRVDRSKPLAVQVTFVHDTDIVIFQPRCD